ncbi:MAG: hypothetical protein FJX74_11025 [Armatimonadetes bacterium]|nr:hypothetical protein [Armatimonadota bacterium]
MLRTEWPFHGAVLNRHHGEDAGGALRIVVTGQCELYGSVTVNGAPAKTASGRFEASVTLTERETDLAAVQDGAYGRQEHRVRVVWDRHSFPRYRFSIDDNSFFLRDIARRQYASLFDCFYLDMLRTLNREYGAKFTVNIYLEAQEEFGQPQFLLPDFPDRYRAEWEACADWLGLAFHAHANRPDRPYQYAAPEQLMRELGKVEEQIARFAGEQSLVPPTVIHWGMIVPEAYRPLYDHGVRVLSGFGHPTSHGYDVNYWLDHARSEYLWNHDCLMDFASGLVFSRVDIVCNNTPIDRIAPTLEPLAADPNHAEIMDLFTHEQYFWDFYANYVPDHPQRLDATIRWVTERGYKPVFFHEGFMGASAK